MKAIFYILIAMFLTLAFAVEEDATLDNKETENNDELNIEDNDDEEYDEDDEEYDEDDEE
ncbi:Hypothetical protein EHI5A_179740, partial [Entamoeba histolytica KU27]